MLKQIIGCGILIISSLAFAQNQAGEIVIPGFTMPSTTNEVSKPNKLPKPSKPTEVIPENPPVQKTVTPPPPQAEVMLPIQELPPPPPAFTLTKEQKERWRNYLNKLRACETGTHTLHQINPALRDQFGQIETDIIRGWDNNICIVTVQYYANNDPRLAPSASIQASGGKIMKYPSGLECQLSRAAIESFITVDADLLEGREVKVSVDDPFSQAVAQQCQPYVVIDGQKTMINPANQGMATY